MRLLMLMTVAAALLPGQPPKVKLWSLQPVARPAVPAGAANPIDAFLAQKQQDKGLHAAGPADRLTLLRRVTLDLTGLPPTPAEQAAFLADPSPAAYEHVVDRLLESKQHGVAWARHWLDVLRYADLDGLDGSVMPAAPGIYHWRDWVIDALNQDMPYDQFVRAQILGNRYGAHSSVSATGQRSRPEANPKDQFALGFLARAALTRGDKDQDIAIQAVETISAAFLGMTVACAKCHDHRFDPIRQTDYYAMKALFDPLVLRRVVLATPEEINLYGTAMEAYQKKKSAVEEEIEALVGTARQRLYDERVALLPAEVQAIIRKSERQRTVEEQKTADDYFPVLRIDPPKIKEILTPEQVERYSALLKREGALERPRDLRSHWIVEEDPIRAKAPSYVLTSGDPARPEKDKPVEPGFPFQPEGIDFRDGRREGFVDWLTAPANPLFARVAVNRIWKWHFGEGLQTAVSDFGLLGGRPRHPKLLDYLASEFVAHGYSMRWLHRLIVTSEAYRRASAPDPQWLSENRRIDAENANLWRFPLRRLEAEPLWDSIQLASGELDLAVGGPSFQLVNPDGKQKIFLPRDGTFQTKANRRGIYMARGYIPSTDVMSPFLQAFDVDDGRTPCPVRTETVTAPQALFTMNDPVVDKAAERMAARARELAPAEGVDRLFRETLGRPAGESERERALRFVAPGPERWKGLAWALFNLDEFLYVK